MRENPEAEIMKRNMRFLVNDQVIQTEAWEGALALDFIRKELELPGTKEGCREGDCGACAVLLGERFPGGERYRAVPSCLLALGEAEGSHIVTIEGLSSTSPDGINPIMQAILGENASQCGFCSPGFVVALTSFLLAGPPLTIEGAVRAVEGNLCRCTGYAAIVRAAERLIERFADLPDDFVQRVAALEAAKVVPPSLGAFLRGELLNADSSATVITERPETGKSEGRGKAKTVLPLGAGKEGAITLGGGTDFFVRNPDPEILRDKSGGTYPPVGLIDRDPARRNVRRTATGGAERLEIGAALSWTDFFANAEVRAAIPGIERHESKLASILVRNRATLGGNVANASPVADLTSMLIALGSLVGIEGPDGANRELPLEKLFLGYKRLDLKAGEIIAYFAVPVSKMDLRFNFEKASKRANLDIAAVNTACAFEVAEGRIRSARISAGGVAPVPYFLAKTSAFLSGKRPDSALAREAAAMAVSEVSPIGDVRGSADYRKRVLERLVLAHFIQCFPEAHLEEELLP
jgi:xanthine dehydrogenase small subunit